MSDTASMVTPFDMTGLWEISQFTDMKAGVIRMFTPVTDGGLRDTERTLRFFSDCVVQYGKGQFKVEFEITAKSLSEACEGFAAAAEKAGTDALTQMQDRSLKQSLLMPGGQPALRAMN